ncbi:MAG: hypothetical protein KJ077_30895 [Anaerolineae bacterium]|nr:hypothetical protein [Anaerolineae bacterium]
MTEALLGAIVGAIVSFILPYLAEWLKLSRTTGIDGIWISIWEVNSLDGPVWVSEKVRINQHFGKLKFVNTENNRGFTWSGLGRLVNKRYIIGEWSETRPGAHSSGVFVFTISPAGNSMYGNALGTNIGNVEGSRWILGRTETDLEFGKRLFGVESSVKL